MAMYEDTRKALERIQKELLAEENRPSDDEWWETEMAEAKALLGMDVETPEVYNNFANDYGKKKTKKKTKAQPVEEVKEEEPQDDTRGQRILMFLLLLGIAAVGIYWARILL